MKTHIAILLGTLLLPACATRQEVIVDPKGVAMDTYQDDLAQCRQISRQAEHKVIPGAVGGAMVGGLIGATLGNKNTAKTGAGLGAIGGALRGGGASKRERAIVVKNCMRHRGYIVLN